MFGVEKFWRGYVEVCKVLADLVLLNGNGFAVYWQEVWVGQRVVSGYVFCMMTFEYVCVNVGFWVV